MAISFPDDRKPSAEDGSAAISLEQGRTGPSEWPGGWGGAGEPVRILHVINGEHYSGAERVQDLLAARLPAEGFQVGFACVKPGRFPETRRARDAPLYKLPMRSKWDLRPAAALARIACGEGYRLIHAHTPRSALVGRVAAGLAGVPLVYHVHSPAARDSTRRWSNWLNARIERWSVRDAARLIAVSSSLGRFMVQQGFARNQVCVVPNGVPALDPVPDRMAPGEPWTVGTVALFRPRKGLEVLLDAVAQLRREGRRIRLRAVGPFATDDYEQQLKRRADHLGIARAVHWAGFTDDVNAALATMDLFILPSLFGEGLPMVVLEAMAAGVPVIGTNVEGVPEAIRDGRDGLIAQPSDPDDLARAIARVMDGEVDWSALRASALRRQAERYSDRSMAAGVAKVYREVLGGGQRALDPAEGARAAGIAQGPAGGPEQPRRSAATKRSGTGSSSGARTG